MTTKKDKHKQMHQQTTSNKHTQQTTRKETRSKHNDDKYDTPQTYKTYPPKHDKNHSIWHVYTYIYMKAKQQNMFEIHGNKHNKQNDEQKTTTNQTNKDKQIT